MKCETCGAPDGYVAGIKLVRANESKRDALRKNIKLRSLLFKSKLELERWNLQSGDKGTRNLIVEISNTINT